jgi:hypothetical protein
MFMAAEGRTEPLANPTRLESRGAHPMRRVGRRLTIAISLATLLMAFGASATLALSPNASCQAHISLGISNPGEVQRDLHWPGFGHEEVRAVARWAGTTLEECEEVFGGE